jgi:hypothetical protein
MILTLNTNIKTAIFSLGSMLVISACATTPDPEIVCSADWIAPRAERAMKEFKQDTRSTFRTFKKTGNRLQKGQSLGPIQMLSMMSAINGLADKFKNGKAMRDMRTLANTCDDPSLIKNAMTDYMREQGISENFIDFINDIDVYKNLLETGIVAQADPI